MVGRKLGRRKVDDAWVLKMNQTINKSTQEQAADAVAAALAEGMDPEAVGEAISLDRLSRQIKGSGLFFRPSSWSPGDAERLPPLRGMDDAAIATRLKETGVKCLNRRGCTPGILSRIRNTYDIG